MCSTNLVLDTNPLVYRLGIFIFSCEYNLQTRCTPREYTHTQTHGQSIVQACTHTRTPPQLMLLFLLLFQGVAPDNHVPCSGNVISNLEVTGVYKLQNGTRYQVRWRSQNCGHKSCMRICKVRCFKACSDPFPTVHEPGRVFHKQHWTNATLMMLYCSTHCTVFNSSFPSTRAFWTLAQ